MVAGLRYEDYPLGLTCSEWERRYAVGTCKYCGEKISGGFCCMDCYRVMEREAKNETGF